MKFQGKITYKPSSAADPIPWLSWLFVDGVQMDCRWRGTREEAIQALTEMRDMYLDAGAVEWIDLPSPTDPRDFT